MNALVGTLLLVVSLFAVFAACARRGLLSPREAGWLGAAFVFWATAQTLAIVTPRVRLTWGAHGAATLGLSALLTLPLMMALGLGVAVLVRSLRVREVATCQLGPCCVHLMRGQLSRLDISPPPDALLRPVWDKRAKRDAPAVTRALRAALQQAKRDGARRVALPDFGANAPHVSPAESAALTLDAIMRAAPQLDEAWVVVDNPRILRAFRAVWVERAAS